MFELKITIDGQFVNGRSFLANGYEFFNFRFYHWTLNKRSEGDAKSLYELVLNHLYGKDKIRKYPEGHHSKTVFDRMAEYNDLKAMEKLSFSFSLNGKPFFNGKADFAVDIKSESMVRRLFCLNFEELLDDWIDSYERALKTNTVELELMKYALAGYMTDSDIVETHADGTQKILKPFLERRYRKLDRLPWHQKMPLLHKAWAGEVVQEDLNILYFDSRKAKEEAVS